MMEGHPVSNLFQVTLVSLRNLFGDSDASLAYFE